MIRQLNTHNQVVIPKEYIAALGIRPEDYLDIRLGKGEIHLRPVTFSTSYTESELAKLKKLFAKGKKHKLMQAKEFLKHLENL